MRKIDKKLNLSKANLLVEQRYLASKNPLNENNLGDLIIIKRPNDYILVNKVNKNIEANLGSIEKIESSGDLCSSIMKSYNTMFETLSDVYHKIDGDEILGPLSACKHNNNNNNNL